MSKDRKIKPELLGGFRDYIPDVMLAKQEVLSTIRRSFEQFGFLPLDTPALERSAVLGTDTNEFKMEVYRFTAQAVQALSVWFSLAERKTAGRSVQRIYAV